MDVQKKTALLMLAAINAMTVVKLFVYFGDYELSFWLAAAVPFFVFRRACALNKKHAQENIFLYALLFTGGYLALWWGSGYIDGFGHSPYSPSAMGILRNVGLFGGVIAAQELARAFALGGSRRNSPWMAALTAVSFLLYDFNFHRLQGGFSSLGSMFPYVGGTLIPAVVGATYLTWLSRAGGPAPALAYRLVPEMIQWLLPALPKTGWQNKMMLGAAFPLFAMMIMQQMAADPRKRRGTRRMRSRHRRTAPVAWAALLACLTFLFAFFLGALPYKPMVIATGSMLPSIRPGDMVILREADAESIQVGDIVAYQADKYQIVHRVAAIQPTAGGNSFVMKGDNNDAPDAKAVEDTQIMGKVVQVVPYVGLLSLAVRTGGTPLDVPVETGN